MNTPSKPNVQAEDEQEPVVSFTHLIEVAPSSASFGGWGPKVVGFSSGLIRWN
ncbi:MAG TPA: hypothetical protein VNF68_07630 [Candidatus Baltobacteraceae bacterium]|nr:hypothetical protein [Candidatus Baltobacteraceae bacterium]